MLEVRGSGQIQFTNVTEKLLYAFVDTDNDGTVERYPIFSSNTQGYLWDYDNTGAKVLQLRFYKSGTVVPTISATPEG